jgi:hypothetical protein
MVSAMEMASLLWQNNGNNIHCAEFHISEHLRMYRFLRETGSFPLAGMEMTVFWQQWSETQVYITFPR